MFAYSEFIELASFESFVSEQIFIEKSIILESKIRMSPWAPKHP